MRIEWTRGDRKVSQKLPPSTANKIRKLAAERQRREAARIAAAAKRVLRNG